MLSTAKTTVIIGAGFSGIMTAIQMARQGTVAQRVVIVERNKVSFGGRAYGAAKPNYRLNVPAGNMSALPCSPDHFLDYCRKINPSVTSGQFMPRCTYGEYLHELLDTAMAQYRPTCELGFISGQVISLTRSGDGWRVLLADGQAFLADKVVLALGNFAPSPLASLAGLAGVVATVTSTAPILLIGSGLTAIDSALERLNKDLSRPVILCSRRGLLPQAHRPQASSTPAAELIQRLTQMPGSVRAYTRAIREEISAYSGDWRDIVAALRPITLRLWQALSEIERGRFMRHLQPYWDTHRHRLAADVHHELMGAINSGRIRVVAGRLLRVERKSSGLRAYIKPRGQGISLVLDVQEVVNCTSPESRIQQIDDPLVHQLIDSQIICADVSGCGLRVDGQYRVLDPQRQPVAGLHYIGPWLKALYWEATAVPELRQHAQRLASVLISEHEG